MPFINLGTGQPYSIKQLVAAFEKTIGHAINQQINARHSGDLPVHHAVADKAKALLNWEAGRSLQSMCDSAWNFHERSMQID